MNVAIVSQREYISPDSLDPYLSNILREDDLIVKALAELGLTSIRVGWDDDTFDWSSVDCAIIRETWDYFHRIDEFKIWLEYVSKKTQLINPLKTVQWNLDKHYLLDCEAGGVHIPETTFLEVGSNHSLGDLLSESGWAKGVLKPCVSGAARHTYVVNKENVEEHQLILNNLIQNEAMMFQEFQKSVPVHGEWTLVLIGGKYTHAILKKAKPGDFRVQDDFGGTVHDYDPTDEEVSFAEKAMTLVDPIPTYGRVDIIRDNDGELALQELELIEPELWLRNCPEAATQLAKEIERLLT